MGAERLLGPPGKLQIEEVGEQRAYLAILARIEDDQPIFLIEMRRDRPIRNADRVVASKCAIVGREMGRVGVGLFGGGVGIHFNPASIDRQMMTLAGKVR